MGMNIWTPAGLTAQEVTHYHQRVRELMRQGVEQETAERDAWYEYYQQCPEKFPHRVIFHFAPAPDTRKEMEPPVQLTLKEYKERLA
jgi:hypothetical protein